MDRFEIGIMGGFGALIVLLLILLFLRGRAVAVSTELGVRLARAEEELRTALSRADRAEMHTQVVVTEVERLRAAEAEMHDLLRAANFRLTDQAAEVARLEAASTGTAEVTADLRRRLEEAEAEVARQRARVADEQAAQRQLQAQIAALRTQLGADARAADEKIALLTQVRDEMQQRFRQLADEALKVQGEQFGMTQTQRLEQALSPLKEHVGHFEKELREVHQETVKDRERLKSEIAQLTRRSEQLSQEAVALTRALKGDQQKQGAWGEMVLETILERSGLRKGEEYETQAHRQGVDGERLRPDVVVKLPGGKSLVIDSKVSLNDYTAAINGESDLDILPARKRHVQSVRAHINRLTAKSYQLAEGLSVDYVIMFIPIEGALSEALRDDPGLTEYALERHITIATPTTLMMALRTVANVWAVERRNQNAEAIAKRAGLLYDKIVGFVGSMEKVGKGLDAARNSYDSAMGQLSRGKGNVLSQIDTLRGLGAKVTKSISMEFDGSGDTQMIEGEAPAALEAPEAELEAS